MDHRITGLLARLEGHVDLGKHRLSTLGLLITGVVGARTVNLSHVACERGGRVRTSSTYRRLQRFFQHAPLERDWAAGLLGEMCGPGGAWTLCLDRTSWQVGQRHVSMLVLALATRRHRIPLMWTQLARKGNSSTPERIALMERFIARFGQERIGLLLADREFVSEDWLSYLTQKDIPFVGRLRHSLIGRDEAGHCFSLKHRFSRRSGARPRALTLFESPKAAGQQAGGLTLTVSAKRLPPSKRREEDLLILASNRPGLNATSVYRKRWAIECLFGDTKTRGLNMEDTRITDPRKLDILMSIVALAAAWSSRTAALITGRKPLPRKAHGYFAKSFFRTGFDAIRNRLRSDNLDPFAAWGKPANRQRVV